MGCSGSTILASNERFTQSREEKILSNLELNLPFSHKKTRELVNTFRLNSHSGYLTSLQLARAINDLSWTPYMQSKNNSISRIIGLLANDGKTPVISLCFLSVLLSKDTVENKAQILFSLIDTEANGEICEDKLRDTLIILFKISVEVLPCLALDNQSLNDEEVKGYTMILKRKEKTFVQKVVKEVMKDERIIGKSEFVERICGLKDFRDFLTARGIRNLVSGDLVPNPLFQVELEISDPDIPKIIIQEALIIQEAKNNEDPESPTLDYTSSEESSDDFDILIHKKEPKMLAPKKKPTKPKPLEKNMQKPPRPTRSRGSSAHAKPSPNILESLPSPKALNPTNFFQNNEKLLSPPQNNEKEVWSNGGEKKTFKKVRCSSTFGRKDEGVTLKYNLKGKIIEIEVKSWEDPIKVAHNFSVKNQLGKRERNSIALMLTKLIKSQN
ncbi:hypothetical protein SteCoe_17401 [Stentor coeruleus]|uniref:EF-hand domain-containing protein n=1 Tax=Stentor coeruleus TaxID=5963 RepID=A0A1R2BZ11_9CILI|nr:hypothetical protein SteCoe_17401 [Stentor coeruleus]